MSRNDKDEETGILCDSSLVNKDSSIAASDEEDGERIAQDAGSIEQETEEMEVSANEKLSKAEAADAQLLESSSNEPNHQSNNFNQEGAADAATSSNESLPRTTLNPHVDEEANDTVASISFHENRENYDKFPEDPFPDTSRMEEAPSEEQVRQIVGSVVRRRGLNSCCEDRKKKWFILGSLVLVLFALIVILVVVMVMRSEESSSCQTDNDCEWPDTWCGLSSAKEGAPKMCCPSRMWYGSDAYCDNRPVGTVCEELDNLCSSSLCISGTCASEALDDNQPCTQSSHCKSGACSRTSPSLSASLVCCHDGKTASLSLEDGSSLTICTNKPPGFSCGNIDSACASGICTNGRCAADKLLDNMECKSSTQCKSRECARAVADYDSPPVCCASGESISGRVRSGSYYETASVCTDMPVGTYCRWNDAMCSSGRCIGEFCDDEPSDDYAPCTKSYDCQSGACYLGSANASAPSICCPGGRRTSGYIKVDEQSVVRTLCASMPVGTVCNGVDFMCASGLCINGTCAAERLGDNELCTSNSHCKKSYCARLVADYDASQFCCPSGSAVSGILKYGTGSKYGGVCKNMKTGTFCNNINSMCASGLCISGTCATEKLNDNATCSLSEDCKNGACGRAVADYEASPVCCPSGRTVSGRVRDGTEYRTAAVCSNMWAGSFCGEIDSMCLSGLCINSFCADEALEDYAPCAESNDCQNRACSLPIANSTAPSICCPGGRTTKGYIIVDGWSRYARMCANMPIGTFCNDIDTMCASGLCINGICASEALEDYESCTKSSDCNNRACSLASANSTAPTICCPGGRTTSGRVVGGYSSYTNVCDNMPIGTFCNDIDTMCASGLCINGRCAAEALDDSTICALASDCKSGACGRAVADYEASPVCCPSGSSLSGRVRYDTSYTTATVCKGAGTGTYCREIDSMCLSGLCIGGVCAEEALEDNAICTSSNDCQNRTCSRASANASAPFICCPGGETSWWSSSICANRPIGTFCDDLSSICASGLCVNRKCATEKLSDNETCTASSDCQNGVCSLPSANSSASLICCPNGETTSGRVVGGYYSSTRVCSNRPLGTFCNDIDSMCSSGHCVNGVCQEDQLEDLASCTVDSDCKNSSCELSLADIEAHTVCCPNGNTITGAVDGSSYSRTVCASMPIGTYCRGLHSMCASGSCINASCSKGLEDYSSCEEPEYCINKACARSGADFDAPKICCPGGATTLAEVIYGESTTTFSEVCAGLKAGTFCLSTDAMCASGECEDGNCSD